MFGVAWAFVAHTDSHFDTEMLCRFVRAYQEVQPLTIGELWAVAITLRIVLVENLRRLAELIMRQQRRAAGGGCISPTGCWARADAQPEPASVVLAELKASPLPDAFAVQLVHRLRDQDPRITPALTWLDQHLAAQGTTADAVVRDEHQRQGAGVVTVRNIITSMRLISDVDWTELFERISLVDDMLAAGSELSRHGFPDAQSLSQRHRGTGARLGPHRTRHRRARRHGGGAGVARRAIAIEAERRSDPGYHLLAGGRRRIRGGDRLPATAERLARTL